ncbi:hypothetical protein VB005_10259 [Metarhizium brunneum]
MPSNRTPEAKYDHLSDSESDDASSFLKLRSTSHHWGQSRGLVVGLCGIIAALLTALFVMVWQHMASPSQLQCAKLNSPFCQSFASQKLFTFFILSIVTDLGAAPAWDGVEFWEGDFENEFPHKTLYRGPPTPEREKAWEDLWLHTPVTVPERGIAALNKTGKPWLKSDDGKGYTALLEVFHQLHCLNVVRQFTWRHLYSEEDMPVDIAEPVAGRMHVDHCIETLRLSLMCYDDVAPLMVYVDLNAPIGHRADFNVHHNHT